MPELSISRVWKRAGGFVAIVATVLALAGIATASDANERPLRGIALVIGNGDYEHIPALANPANDARAVERLLSRLGFDTVMVSDRQARRFARDLDNFIQDAAGADLAVVYYAGHGIEAGGENFLVPVDAALSPLDAVSESLVPVSAFVAKLQAIVPITIFMLDACRNNPFPAGTTVRLDEASGPVPVGPKGLAEVRGAQSLVRPNPRVEDLGTLIAFAASPKEAASDGHPGENSPYAAAVLRHLDAMATGSELGIVMRMITEEVYLKTDGAQRPWVYENLRRLLYFGDASEQAVEANDDILSERRRLLVKIASLSQSDRLRVQQVARAGGVPMDAVYGMLMALGVELPDNPAEAERLLREQIEPLRELVARKNALTTRDAELTRLAEEADRAIAEGAIKVAIERRERAKARVVELDRIIAETQTQIAVRHIEYAEEVYARSARTYEIAFQYEKAAADYEIAYRYAAAHDRRLAGQYLLLQSRAVRSAGYRGSELPALERAADLSRHAVALLEDDQSQKAFALRTLGNNLHVLGWHRRDAALMKQAVEAFREAETIEARDHAPLQWAENQHLIGRSLEFQSWLEADAEASLELLRSAYQHLSQALEIRTRDASPSEWASSASMASTVLHRLARAERSLDLAAKAIEFAEGAAQIITSADDLDDWLSLQSNLAAAVRAFAYLISSSDDVAAEKAYRRSIAILKNALDKAEHAPMSQANMLNNLGGTYHELWMVSRSPTALPSAEHAYLRALDLIEGLDAGALRETASRGVWIVSNTMQKLLEEADAP